MKTITEETKESIQIDLILCEVKNELYLAEKKFPQFPKDFIHQCAIMAEEAGEAVRAANQAQRDNGSLQDLRNEYLQTAAMCVRAINALGTLEYVLIHVDEKTLDRLKED